MYAFSIRDSGFLAVRVGQAPAGPMYNNLADNTNVTSLAGYNITATTTGTNLVTDSFTFAGTGTASIVGLELDLFWGTASGASTQLR